MERVWVFDNVAVAVMRVDFLDPALAHEPDTRERGVRIEVRPALARTDGSIYASSTTTLQPAVCRIDFLESSPGAADRMHWHPGMRDGEPESRTFDTDMPADPVGWLTRFLRDDLDDYLAEAEVVGVERDLEAIRQSAGEIGDAVTDGLAWARQPWPEAEHDERGMATVR